MACQKCAEVSCSVGGVTQGSPLRKRRLQGITCVYAESLAVCLCVKKGKARAAPGLTGGTASFNICTVVRFHRAWGCPVFGNSFSAPSLGIWSVDCSFHDIYLPRPSRVCKAKCRQCTRTSCRHSRLRAALTTRDNVGEALEPSLLVMNSLPSTNLEVCVEHPGARTPAHQVRPIVSAGRRPRITDTGTGDRGLRGEAAVAAAHWRDRTLQFFFLLQTARAITLCQKLVGVRLNQTVNRAPSLVMNISWLSGFALVLLMYFDVLLVARGPCASSPVLASVPIMCCGMVFPGFP